MFSHCKRRLYGIGFGFACLFMASCSTAGSFNPVPSTGASLTGTVTYKKEHLKIGIVLVQGKTDGAQGRIGEDGHYTVENVPVGEVTLVVTLGSARGEQMGQAAAAKAKGEKVTLAKIPNIPAKYTSPATSPIKTTIQKGSNTFNIELE